MSIDLSSYLDIFADEAREHLQALNDALLEFEKTPANLDLVNVMFRSAHTLKGMSATMGFNEIAELTHKMENLLTPVRTGELKANDAIIEALFQCLDMLQEMVEAHIAQEDHGVDVSELVATLETLLTGEPVAVAASEEDALAGPAGDAGGYPGELNAGDKQAIITAENNGKNVYHVAVKLEDSCELRNVRAFMVLKALKDTGDLLHSVPPESTLVEEDFGFSFDLLLATGETKAEVERTVQSVLEVDTAKALAWGEDGEPATAGAPRAVGDVFQFNEYDLTLIRQAQSEGFGIIHVHVQLTEDCTLKSARAFMVHKKLEEHGEIIKIAPEVEDIEFERFDRDLDFLLLSQSEAPAIVSDINGISEIAAVQASSGITLPGTAAPAADEPGAPAEAKPAVAEPSAALAGASIEKAPGTPVTKPTGKAVERAKPAHTIRVDTQRLDALLNLVGELVIGKTRLAQLASEVRHAELTDTIEQIDHIVFDLQNVVMQTRMMPIETVFKRFPRMIRDLAKQRGKQIELKMTGGETELDRTVIDEIGDPLVHLIRNTIDHGIETPEEREAAGKDPTGVLTLAAYHEGNAVFIEVKDDGKGIDPAVIRLKSVEKGILSEEKAAALNDQEAVEMIFAAGLSTVEKVSDVSGRGVGMDVVRTKIEELSGKVLLTSVLDKGTNIVIKLPLTLAIVQALMVDIAGEVFAVPLAYIETTLRLWPKDVQQVNQQDVYTLRGEILPLVSMRELFDSPDVERQDESFVVVVVQSGKQRIGLCIDQPIGQTEIVIKTLGTYLQDTKYIAGGTILGDGTVALIIDVANVAE